MKNMEESVDRETISKKKKCTGWIINQIKERIPILVWFPKYKWRENIVADLIAGVTLMFVNVPQGLAFSVLANVDLMYGLHTACFTALIYTFLGTAHISSFGPTAVGSMMIGEAVSDVKDTDYSANQIAVVITFIIGVFYLISFLAGLGVLSMIFRRPFVVGFITACAFQIISKSLKLVLGLKIPGNNGMFCFFKNLYALFENRNLINYPTVITSVILITVLLLNNILVRPLLAKFTTIIVIPIEAVVMLAGIAFSYYLDFENMGIPILGDVPTGFPNVTLPEMNLVPEVLSSSVVIALVNFSTTVAMTMLFNSELNGDQELFAMAVANIVCSNFHCISMGNSMMRTVIAVNIGVKSLLATLISSLLLIFVILFGGPLFYSLPSCVLGSIILVSAGQLLFGRLKEVITIWRKSIEDGIIWFGALAAGLILELKVGMVVGALLSVRQILNEVDSREALERRIFPDPNNVESVNPERTSLLLLREHDQDPKNV